MKTTPERLDGGMVSFRADAELWARLHKLAESEDRKLADTVRRLVLKALKPERKVAK